MVFPLICVCLHKLHLYLSTLSKLLIKLMFIFKSIGWSEKTTYFRRYVHFSDSFFHLPLFASRPLCVPISLSIFSCSQRGHFCCCCCYFFSYCTWVWAFFSFSFSLSIARFQCVDSTHDEVKRNTYAI